MRPQRPRVLLRPSHCFGLIPVLAACLSGCVVAGPHPEIQMAVRHAGTEYRIDPGSYAVLGQGEGHACHYRLLGWLPLNSTAVTVNARKNALQPLGGDALIDPKEDPSFLDLVLFNRRCVTMAGTVVKFKRTVAAGPE